jgi:peptide-methionine (S)-S-oxide reductase
MKYLITFFSAVLTITCLGCGHSSSTSAKIAATPALPTEELSKLSQATFASGCFWCVEAVFESVKGVKEAVSGYAGGTESNPTYEEVGSGRTNHAEAVTVYYDSSTVDYPTLLKVYFASQDPTQVNGQGPDHGRPYRSIIFYNNAQEKNWLRIIWVS